MAIRSYWKRCSDRIDLTDIQTAIDAQYVTPEEPADIEINDPYEEL